MSKRSKLQQQKRSKLQQQKYLDVVSIRGMLKLVYSFLMMPIISNNNDNLIQENVALFLIFRQVCKMFWKLLSNELFIFVCPQIKCLKQLMIWQKIWDYF